MKTLMLKKVTIICLISLSAHLANAQLVWTIPSFPLETSPVTVFFDATLGSGGLAGYTGDVYAHTGVITDKSTSNTDWKYVKTNWGVNSPATLLIRTAPDTYKLLITPDIRSYYGVPQNEKILKMAFVFRSGVQVGGQWLEGKTSTGGDILIDVYKAGLKISIINPDQKALLVNLGASIPVQVESTFANSIQLLVNGQQLSSTPGNSVSTTLNASSYGKYLVKAIAVNDTGAVADSFYYFVRRPLNITELPSGIKEGINYLNDSSAILSLYAPSKQFAFVLGDFNNWQYDSLGYMNSTADRSRYWLKLEHLKPGKEYIYQYEVDGQIRIGDPYADKVSDPWNDKYIPASVYPNLISYPIGKTSGIATVLQTAQPEYTWQNTSFTPPAKTNLVIYELLVRDFVATHNYQTLKDTLDYLKRLGINAIELMPVSEFEGNLSWGYNPNFYFAPDKYYGTKTDLKQFIDICHANGIAVIQDMVLNHSFGTSPMAMLYWDAANNRPAADNPWFNPIPKHDYNVGNDFNHESMDTRRLVGRVLKYWLNEYHVDGFRFDLSKGFTQTNTLGNTGNWGHLDASRIAIWKRIADSIRSVKPDTYIILEHFADNDEETLLSNYGLMMWGNSTYNYGEGAMGWVNTSDFSWTSYKNRGWADPNLVSYMESHDEERLMFKNIKYGNSTIAGYNLKDTLNALRRQELAALFFFTIPGPKMVWQFGEIGYDYSIDFNGRTGEKPIRWDYRNNFQRSYLSKFYASLINLKTTNELFATRSFTLSLSGAMKRISLSGNGKSASIIGNFGLETGVIDPAFSHTGTWYDYFSGDSVVVTNVNAQIQLPRGGYRLYTDFRLSKPEIGTGMSHLLPKTTLDQINVFPNPSDGNFSVSYNLASPKRVKIELDNLHGNKLMTLMDENRQDGDQFESFSLTSYKKHELMPGIYLIHFSSGNINSFVKLVIKPQ
jgi:glycosidase